LIEDPNIFWMDWH